MHPLFKRRLGPIAAIILVFFTWFCIEPWNYALAIQDPPKLKTASSSGQKTAPEKFEDSLRAAKQLIQDLDEQVIQEKDITSTLDVLKSHRQVIETADAGIRAEFAETEAKLKAAKLPAEIVDRHRKAVAKYEANFERLQNNLQAIEQLERERKEAEGRKDQSTAKAKHDRLKQRVKEAKAHLQDKVKERPHTPLDPNKLPFRTPTVKEQKPRLKKEEFTEFLQPIQRAFNGDPSTLLVAQSTPNLPKPEDLAETIEVQFTQEIKDLAAQLAYNPVKIYNWVRHNVDFIPTRGSIQGATHCLQTKQCNAFDTASLLIALLRVSGIPARYVAGTIEVPTNQLMNWVGGFTDLKAAVRFILTGGIPATRVISGETITAVRLEHVWVEAYVDYIPSRGAVHKQGDTWIPLDASFKQFTYANPMDIPTTVGFDTHAFINEISAGSIIDPSTSSVSNVPQTLVVQRTQEYIQKVQQHFQSHPETKIGDVFGAKVVMTQEFSSLPAVLPYKIIVEGATFSEISDTLRHTVSFQVITSSFLGPDFTYTLPLPHAAGKRITLSYAPASSSDAAVIEQYGSLEATPPYLLQLTPELKIEGVTVASGGPIGSGSFLSFNMMFSGPAYWANEEILNTEIAGAYLAVGLNLNQVSKGLIDTRVALLDAALHSPDASVDEKVGETLFLLSQLYYGEADASMAISARFGNVVYSRLPSEAILGEALGVAFVFESAFQTTFGGLFIDSDYNLMNPHAQDGDRSKTIPFMINAGFHASSMEHAIFEQIYNVGAVSAVKILQLANAQGIPLFRIDKDNLSTVLPLLQLPGTVTQEVQHAVNAGGIVITPPHSIQYFDWNGIGYIVMSPETGGAGYFISGGFTGGSMALVLDCIQSILQFVNQFPIPASFPGAQAMNRIIRFLDYIATLQEIGQVSRDPAQSATLLAMASSLSDIVGGEPTTLLEFVIASISEVMLFVSQNDLLEGKPPDIVSHLLSSCSELAVIEIISPQSDDNFDLTEENYTATPDIVLKARILPREKTGDIKWTLDLEYETSGGHGPITESRSFQTSSDGEDRAIFRSIGGRVIVHVNATVEGRTIETDPFFMTITGPPTGIPDPDITNQLVGLYTARGGATPRLMTGLAMAESSYQQFRDFTLFERDDKWPNESKKDGGSHIGLMMVVTTPLRAWDWLINTGFGVDFFVNEKLATSRRIVNKFREDRPSLRDLTPVEHENNALIFYGPFGGGGPYYVPNADGTDWVINTAGNKAGVDYANSVRERMR